MKNGPKCSSRASRGRSSCLISMGVCTSAVHAISIDIDQNVLIRRSCIVQVKWWFWSRVICACACAYVRDGYLAGLDGWLSFSLSLSPVCGGVWMRIVIVPLKFVVGCFFLLFYDSFHMWCDAECLFMPDDVWMVINIIVIDVLYQCRFSIISGSVLSYGRHQ